MSYSILSRFSSLSTITLSRLISFSIFTFLFPDHFMICSYKELGMVLDPTSVMLVRRLRVWYISIARLWQLFPCSKVRVTAHTVQGKEPVGQAIIWMSTDLHSIMNHQSSITCSNRSHSTVQWLFQHLSPKT